MAKLQLFSVLVVCALQLVSAGPIAIEFSTPAIQRSLRAEVDSSSSGSVAMFEKEPRTCHLFGLAYACYSWFRWS
ncbi:hypothetical protein PF005_g14197 [Phytophthora fragariae]|uniref:RxLR effector protein n=1 Tax=Phytophthora fragariae TaxID=53985 RepID=A0A6A3RU46_9STRA|nr:hypothetical protein PF003_g15434 [Phytophthora fragariae]KAE8934534.1 hypothetical protein PF009_g15482 [Phytophthora fragariae]KAE8989672.1 hypothetical protein PF011_g18662 [Phytophthora fragariae]KAE9103154.1 hypothetical protein PF010_g13836 [Phytophthora fragariae]KAE9103314.1 hypothetical protein PF007_g14445 [Phytophthora fragariae]